MVDGFMSFGNTKHAKLYHKLHHARCKEEKDNEMHAAHDNAYSKKVIKGYLKTNAILKLIKCNRD